VLSRWSRQVHLGFPEARRQLRPGKHTEITTLGNPIRPPDATLDRRVCRAQFGLRSDSTVILVVGGSQGSRAVNEALLAALGAADGLSENAEVLWATGPANFAAVSARLQQMNTGDWVKPVAYINEMPAALAAADIAISRAGAMATAELLAWGIPALLIPLPTAAADHQTHNARALAEAGAALLLTEAELTGARLLQELRRLIDDRMLRARMRSAALERSRPQAAHEIARRLAMLLDAR
jgi:UDP-N-acetylglucosamine--N-acetylmuramyl-(pentapeptide) pyrophosphoryl-undecaprenol N-acetylglucosamine transferase